MTVEEAAKRIEAALGPAANGAYLAEHQAFAIRLATALNAIGLIPPTTSQAMLQNQSHETTSHHRVDTDTVSAPHPTTTTGQSAKTTADASWQRNPEEPFT